MPRCRDGRAVGEGVSVAARTVVGEQPAVGRPQQVIGVAETVITGRLQHEGGGSGVVIAGANLNKLVLLLEAVKSRSS